MSEELAQKLSYNLLHSQIPHLLKSFDVITLTQFKQLYTTNSSENKLENIIIISSTSGQGELPTPIKNSAIWQFFKRKDLPNDFFAGVNFYFLGIGDSLYLKFQHAIRILKLRFIDRLGGNLKLKLEIDISGMKGSGSVEMVMPQFIKIVKDYIVGGEEEAKEYIKDDIYISMGPTLKLGKPEKESTITNDDSTVDEWIPSKIILNDRITKEDHFQDVRCILIENELEFKPGDTISILPSNEESTINEFLKLQPHLKQYLNDELTITDNGETTTTTLHYLLQNKFDLTSVPKRLFFMKIWNLQETENEDEIEILKQHKQKLYEFGHSDDDYDYLEYVYRPRRSILEILYDFSFIKLPLKYLLDIMPIIRPRQYSISNSFTEENKNAELTVAILEYETLLFKKRLGLCTNYLKNLKPGQEIKYKINHLHLFEKIEPFIMEGVEDILLISPGVGIAPIKSFILEGEYMDFNKTLYFGSRFASKDKLYGDLLTTLSTNKDYNLIYKCCHSRDRDNVIDGKQIKYVQDLLWKEADYVYDLIFNKNCIIYLCGSAGQMPTQVKITLASILEKNGVQNSSEYINDLIKQDRFIQETW
ncbi:riboflavin synthase domain-like protein [Hanseniaspora valbyensis NRRL Y-1626]|uniref:Riboflavin synthase domain-like protein n=1 Tax=Hanseniaspora valbyensis NRRL Y-1626 TaxID=766949 RepID=A0A1B7T9T4_9ASCO|nr:riboflavin synthase domain-like protein [Hanseniaspora valbyensis NRRL Y-1626]